MNDLKIRRIRQISTLLEKSIKTSSEASSCQTYEPSPSFYTEKKSKKEPSSLSTLNQTFSSFSPSKFSDFLNFEGSGWSHDLDTYDLISMKGVLDVSNENKKENVISSFNSESLWGILSGLGG